jgi:hypothetical protein
MLHIVAIVVVSYHSFISIPFIAHSPLDATLALFARSILSLLDATLALFAHSFLSLLDATLTLFARSLLSF